MGDGDIFRVEAMICGEGQKQIFLTHQMVQPRRENFRSLFRQCQGLGSPARKAQKADKPGLVSGKKSQRGYGDVPRGIWRKRFGQFPHTGVLKLSPRIGKKGGRGF